VISVGKQHGGRRIVSFQLCLHFTIDISKRRQIVRGTGTRKTICAKARGTIVVLHRHQFRRRRRRRLRQQPNTQSLIAYHEWCWLYHEHRKRDQPRTDDPRCRIQMRRLRSEECHQGRRPREMSPVRVPHPLQDANKEINPIRSEIKSGDESFYQTMGSIVCCRLGTLAILDCLSRRLWQAGEWNMGRSVRAHKSNSQFLSWKDCIESCCGAPMTRQKHWT